MAQYRILIADDEEGIRESLNLILSDHYTLGFACDGEDTLEQVRSGDYDAVLLDVKMPKLDGMDVLKTMYEEEIRTPVLMLTAYQSVELAREAVRLGAVDYLPKPFEREHVLNAVKNVVEKQGSRC